MKAFWCFCKNDGYPDGPHEPHIPAGVSAALTNPLDIVRMGEAYSHRHLLLGGFGLADDNMDGETGEGHTHIVVRVGETWYQLTRGAAAHNHPLALDTGGNLAPEWFLTFITCSDAAAAAIDADPLCFPVVEAVIDAEGVVTGELVQTAWTTTQRNWWAAAMLSVLGFALPAEVDRGARLVYLFAGCLLSRAGQQESGLR